MVNNRPESKKFMNEQATNLDLELKTIEEDEKALAAQLEEMRKKRQALKDEQERRLNDPKERAKMLKNANDMIHAGVEDYRSKGYFCDVQDDENGVIFKITIKDGKSAKSGTRGPRKKAGDPGFIPAMTKENFSKIYSSLPKEFNNKDIISLLIADSDDVKASNFRTQPALGEILADGFNEIKIGKIGTKGRNVSYYKIN